MPTPSNAFETKNTRAAAEAEQQANAQAEQAGRWFAEQTAQRAEVAKREAACVASSWASDDVAESLAAQSQLRDIETVVNSLERHGGPEGVKSRALTTPEVFSTLEKGYAERAAAIEKLVPAARKALGIRYAALSEAGLPAGVILGDPIAGRLSGHNNDLTAALAAAIGGKGYCEKRGIACGGGTRPWRTLYDCLVMPLPVPPVIPATS